MSLQSELTRLQANATSISSSKDAIMTALASKGVTVPAGATLHDVPNLIGQINGSAPSANPSITFRFANSAFDPTAAEQISVFNDADHWERVTGSAYNDWKFTASGTSIDSAFRHRFATTSASYSTMVLSGTTEVIATSDLDKLTNIKNAFMECNELTWTPNFDVQDGADCSGAFYNCTNVTGYQEYLKLSVTTDISYDQYVFTNVLDASSIPSSWGGTA